MAKARNRLSKIELDEVSLVDAPANPGAHVLLLKRKGSTVTTSTDDSAGPAGDTGNVVQKETQMNDQEKATLAKALSLASMSDAEKTYLKTLTAEKQDEFIKLEAEKRADFIKANPLVVDDGETIEVAGQTIKKSDVGATMFGVLKAQNTQINTMSALLGSTTLALEIETFAKRAEKDYPYLPGSPEEKGAMLREIEKLPDVAKKATLASLKAASDAIKYQTTELGTVGGTTGDAAEGSATAEMEAMVQKHIQANPTLGYDKAYSEILKANPQMYERMEAEKPAKPKAA